jgi:hypothetical protein
MLKALGLIQTMTKKTSGNLGMRVFPFDVGLMRALSSLALLPLLCENSASSNVGTFIFILVSLASREL